MFKFPVTCVKIIVPSLIFPLQEVKKSVEELNAMILQAIKESSAESEGDMGKVMKILAPRIKGVADGKWVNNRA
ncbi:MAG: GatB/YqeY domain-containing protein, partial [Bacteroidales bacterium]|nr:GatB/YqeY domain-containing protein [Bacteroidales bacterium]